MTIRIALAAGGTGGHLFPAEALAAALVRQGYAVALITDARGGAFAGQHPTVDLCPIDVKRSGPSVAAKAGSVFSMAIASLQALRHLRRLDPALVVGFGGYPSLPAIAAAKFSGIPVLLHEQNARLGRANRLLAPFADAIATSFPKVNGIAKTLERKLIYTGNPVRGAFEALREAAYIPPQENGPINLLITGGSQGASVFAEIVPAAIALLPEALRRRMIVTQQCRAETLARVATAYREMGVEAQTGPFFTDMAAKLQACHLAICRAGASTVAELAMVGRPSILIPYPHAMDDHQSDNARAMEIVDGAWMLKESASTPELLAARLEVLLNEPERLAAMAAAARNAGKPNAVGSLCALITNLIEGAAITGETLL